MSDELVRVRDLKKIFSVPAGELHAVDGVDFSIARGSTIGIVGESGCGKSTMGRLLAMLLEATSGEILFDGQNIAKKMSKAEAMAYKKRIQMIFQDPFSSLNPRMTTFETIIEPLNIHRAGTLQEREARVYQLMETVGLSERFVNAYPHELDGGRRQRIGIARALALDPEFIICDEPVSALDVSIQAQILNLLKRLQQQNGYTYLFITHDLAVVKHISNEVPVSGSALLSVLRMRNPAPSESVRITRPVVCAACCSRRRRAGSFISAKPFVVKIAVSTIWRSVF